MKKIQIMHSDKSGFDVLHCFGSWQVGMIKYAEGLEKASLGRLEKHESTDELFVLLKGEASLFVGEELNETLMKQGFVYNIPKGLWHTVTLSKEAIVIVFENAHTETTDKIKLINK